MRKDQVPTEIPMELIAKLEDWVRAHPKVGIALTALVVAVLEALTGVVAGAGEQVPTP